MLSSMDKSGEVTRTSAEAQRALNAGDTERARALFEQAGERLEAAIVNTRKQGEKHLARFLAATQYYKGGHYGKALELCRRAQADLLPAEVRPLYPQFFSDVRDRSSQDYTARVRKALSGHWRKREFQRVLEVLQEHPYVFPRGGMAFLRAVCCEHLHDYHAAAVFYADALRHSRPDPDLVFTSVAYPLTLAQQGNVPEAWQYIEHQLREIPHAVTFINASLLRFRQASATTSGQERRHLSEEQIRFVEEAWSRFQGLPPDQRSHPSMREFMTLGFEAAAFGLLRLEHGERALEVCQTALELDPSSPSPWTVRGIITYPEPRAVADFQEAVRLGEQSYYPYYFLAHTALMQNRFEECEEWCRQALRHRPSRAIEAQLWEWVAISRAQQGATRREVGELFERAQGLDPENQRIRHNRAVFEGSKAAPASPTGYDWDRGSPERSGDLYLSQEEGRLAGQRNQVDWAERELAAVGA